MFFLLVSIVVTMMNICLIILYFIERSKISKLQLYSMEEYSNAKAWLEYNCSSEYVAYHMLAYVGMLRYCDDPRKMLRYVSEKQRHNLELYNERKN